MNKAKILVVEDENLIARDLSYCLNSLGYSVPAVVSSGEEAIKKAEKIHPDLVLMDIILSGEMDGIEASEQIRTRFNIPVLYLTAYLDGDRLQEAMAEEPFNHIIKPFDIWELQTSIEQILYP